MEDYKQTLLLLISTPLYAILIGVEILLSTLHHRKLYTVKDTLINVYLSSLNFGLELLIRVFCLGFLAYFLVFILLLLKTLGFIGLPCFYCKILHFILSIVLIITAAFFGRYMLRIIHQKNSISQPDSGLLCFNRYTALYILYP